MFRLWTRRILRATETKAAEPTGKGLKLRLLTPTEALVKDKVVKMVSLPGTEGMLGVTAQHAPTIAELKPGALSVYYEDSKVVKYFVSGGFAVVEPGSQASVTAAECIPYADLDIAAARKALDDANSNKLKAATDKERAQAQIGVDLYSSMLFWADK